MRTKNIYYHGTPEKIENLLAEYNWLGTNVAYKLGKNDLVVTPRVPKYKAKAAVEVQEESESKPTSRRGNGYSRDSI